MAEALALAASITAILQLTGKLVSLGYEYLGGVKEASKDLRQLVDELHSLGKVLLILQDYARDDRTLQSTALQTLNGQNGPLPGCTLELKRLQLKLEPKQGLRGKVKALLWPLKEKETFQHIAQIERHKGLFNLALAADQLTLSRSIDGYVRDTNHVVHALQSEASVQALHRKNGETLQMAEDRNKILNWLYPESFDKKHLEISGRRQENTTNWVFEVPKFKNWVKDQPDFLMIWGCGIPGAGKTFISSSVIDHLIIKKSAANYGIGYIYFDYIERDQQRPIRILASLNSPKFEDLFTALIAVSKSFDRVFLIFDALDECDQRDQRKDLLPFFHRLARHGISMFLTSRPHPEDIQSSFGNVAKIEISAQVEDIGVYIRKKIGENPRAKRLVGQGKCEDKIISGLVDCAKGMFLLVRFHIEHICQQATVRQILSELESLKNASSGERPLDPTYDRVMDTIRKQPKNCVELALRILSWLVKARRTLTVDELREAVSIELDQYYLDEYDLPDRTTLLDVCASLVTVDENSDTIVLAHYTVQEYLVRNRIILDDAESQLAIRCTTFLSFGVFAQDHSYEYKLQTRPFVRYAAVYLDSHLKKCEESLSVEILLKLLMNRDNLCFYTGVAAMLGKWVIPGDKQSGLPLQAACSLGHCAVVSQLLDDTPSIISVQDRCGYTALHNAVHKGHEEVVRLLLERGADTSALSWNGSTPLYWAVRDGHKEIVELLLERGADASAPSRNGSTPLHWAVREGHKEMVELLLERGADASAPSRNVSTPLYWAVRDGHKEIVELLLERGADTSAPSRNVSTPLHWAVRKGGKEIVELLLERGADTSVLSRNGSTPLHWAVRDGHKEIVELLLERGADTSALRWNGSTPLHWAVRKGGKEIVELLLERGADTSVLNKDGYTALDLVGPLYPQISQLLLAAPKRPSYDSRTPHPIPDPLSIGNKPKRSREGEISYQVDNTIPTKRARSK